MSSKSLKSQIQNGKVLATPHVLILPPPLNNLHLSPSHLQLLEDLIGTSVESVEVARHGVPSQIPELSPFIIQAQLIPDSKSKGMSLLTAINFFR